MFSKYGVIFFELSIVVVRPCGTVIVAFDMHRSTNADSGLLYFNTTARTTTTIITSSAAFNWAADDAAKLLLA
jgi:hypothetical protein